MFGQLRSAQPSYNVQLAVDAELQIIVDSEAVATPTDTGQLAPGAARVAEVLEVRPTAGSTEELAITLLADAGYSSAKDALACERLGLAPVFPVTRTVNPHGDFFDRTAFRWDPDKDRLICPAGKDLKPNPTPDRGAVVYTAKKTDCRVCPLKPRCTKAAARHVTRLLDEAALERVSARLKAAPDLMDKRAQSVEPAFATLKRWMPTTCPRGRPVPAPRQGQGDHRDQAFDLGLQPQTPHHHPRQCQAPRSPRLRASGRPVR